MTLGCHTAPATVPASEHLKSALSTNSIKKPLTPRGSPWGRHSKRQHVTGHDANTSRLPPEQWPCYLIQHIPCSLVSHLVYFLLASVVLLAGRGKNLTEKNVELASSHKDVSSTRQLVHKGKTRQNTLGTKLMHTKLVLKGYYGLA